MASTRTKDPPFIYRALLPSLPLILGLAMSPPPCFASIFVAVPKTFVIVSASTHRAPSSPPVPVAAKPCRRLIISTRSDLVVPPSLATTLASPHHARALSPSPRARALLLRPAHARLARPHPSSPKLASLVLGPRASLILTRARVVLAPSPPHLSSLECVLSSSPDAPPPPRSSSSTPESTRTSMALVSGCQATLSSRVHRI